MKKLHFLLDAVRPTFSPLTTPPEVVALSGICGQQTGGHMRPPRPPGRGAPRGPPGPGPRAPRAPRGPARGPPGPAPRGAKKVQKMGPRSLSCQTEENGIFGPFLAKYIIFYIRNGGPGGIPPWVHFWPPQGGSRGAPPGPPGTKKCTFFWVFNNSPSRDRFWDIFWPPRDTPLGQTPPGPPSGPGGTPPWTPRMGPLPHRALYVRSQL